MIGGTGGELLAALLVAGAFAAFLSTSSGLTIAVAGVLSQDVMSRWLGGIASFRVAAVLAVSVAYVLAVLAEDVGVATAVGLAFAVAASTFCPLLVLGIWWRRLTDVGAIAGLVVGGVTSGAAVLRTFVATEDGGLVLHPDGPARRLDRPARVRRDGRRLPAHPRPPATARHPLHGPPPHPRGRHRRPRVARAIGIVRDVTVVIAADSRQLRHGLSNRSSHQTDRWPNGRPHWSTYAHPPLPAGYPLRKREGRHIR